MFGLPKITRIETAHAYRSMYDLDHVCTLFDGTQLYHGALTTRDLHRSSVLIDYI